MKPNAVVYTSNTGYTKEYAAMLGKKLNLPVYSLEEAKNNLADGSEIIYLGWLMASTVKGYKKAAEKYKIQAVCGVGMGKNGSQLDEVKKANNLPESISVFTLQGGFDMTKLHGIYKFMMIIMKNTLGKSLANKPDRTPDEETMLRLLIEGGSCVSEENLSDILKWYEELK